MDKIRESRGSPEEGVSQGSILSVTLFAIKINSLASVIPKYVLTSLFVDDLQLAYQDHTIIDINSKLQNTVKSQGGQPGTDSDFPKPKQYA